MFYSGFRSLSKLEFKCSVIKQRVTVVLDFMSFEALSCKDGASISICTSRALMLGVVWHILGSTTSTAEKSMVLWISLGHHPTEGGCAGGD